MTAATERGPRKRNGKGRSKKPRARPPDLATTESFRASDRLLRRSSVRMNQMMDKTSDGARRARRPASRTVVAVLSTLCATILVVGVVSLARHQLPAALGSGSDLRPSEVCLQFVGENLVPIHYIVEIKSDKSTRPHQVQGVKSSLR